MTARIIPMHRYTDLAAENARLVDALAVATADIKMSRATAMQANVCIARLVAALADVAPGHPLLGELPFSQYVPEPLPDVELYPCKGCDKPIAAYELCEECAKGNDPFFTSKYKGDFCP